MTEKIKVYIAAPWKKVAQARMAAESLEASGHIEVVSTWHGRKWKANPTNVDCFLEAETDMEELEYCDAIVALWDKEKIGKGMYFELGFALARGKMVFAVVDPNKPYRCVFYHLPAIVKVDSVETLAERLEAVLEAEVV